MDPSDTTSDGQKSGSAKPPQPRLDPVPEVPEKSWHEMRGVHRSFAIDLYKELSKRKGNLCFSPYSISTALVMAYAGAKGSTAEEMKKVLHLPYYVAELHKTNAAQMIELNNRGKQSPFDLKVVNRAWGRENISYETDYLKLLKEQYLAPFLSLNFAENPEQARQTINDWVEKQTNERIKELFPKGTITSETYFVLVNALYFLGTWGQPFEENRTAPRDFWLESGSSVKVPTMVGSWGSRASVGHVDGVTLLDLGYAGRSGASSLSLMMAVPEEGSDLASLEAKLSSRTIEVWRSRLYRNPGLTVYLPKFRIHQSFDLIPSLRALGMKQAFLNSADFSGILKSPRLKIDAVVHKSFIEVDEKGTEATAATGVVMGNTNAAPPPETVRMDRPFLFILYDSYHQTMLFMGRVTHPQKED